MGSFCRASMLVSAAAIVMATASPALAAAGGPPIAYTVASGSTQSIYLANPDGSGAVKLYTTGSKVGIGQLDMRPGGNQMAIVENSIAGGQGILKIIDYSDAGVRQAVTTIAEPGCTAQGVDYHPSDGSLLVARYCNQANIQEVRVYANGAWAADPLFGYTNGNPDRAAGKVRWLGDGSGFLWAESDTTNGARIDRHSLANPYAPVTIYQADGFSLAQWFDVARCTGALDSSCAKVLVTNGSGQIHLIAFDNFGGTDQATLFTSAADGHYSPDNAHILWRQQIKSGYQLRIDSQVYAKASGAKDWRD
jgi:hypothetical protein